ncbi:hypothetical protein BKA70DRAFT_748528 [Coprinopsis sp. MPI-PUGE-AT-0042]|nr:hypothetical protein BKA70DRAFT_748528 [Coprinopsis sp. MPI-PUGE-AT-0042]
MTMPRSQGQNQRPSSAAHRVLFVPELLSLIFGHLAHYSQSEPCLCGCGYVGSAFGGIWEGVGDDGQVEGEGQPCHQPTEDRPANLTFSLTASSSNGVFTTPGPTKRPPHRTAPGPGHTTKVEFKDNKPSYNLNNALVCKTWCGAALDVLWRVVDRPERIFALLDGGVYRGNGEDAKKKFDNQIDTQAKQRRIKTLKMVSHGHGRSPPPWGMGLRSFWKLCKAKEQSLIQVLDHPNNEPHHDQDHDYASNDGSQSSHSSDNEDDEDDAEHNGSGSDSDSESEGEDDDPEDEEDQAVRQDGFVGWLGGLNLSDVVADNWAMGCKKMRWEVYNFTSPPTPASWARFDKYAHRVRHLVYRRPCLSHEALHAIALTRPRMEVFPKMKTLTWADNPLSWSVVFMHPGVKRFEVRLGAWAIEAAITLPEATWHPNADTVAEDANINDQSRRKPLSLRDALTQTLTTHLSNIPNRMPYLTSLSVSSFLPASLLDEALTSSLFPALPGDIASQASAFNGLALTNGIAGIPQIPAPEANPGLQNLVALTLPRFYTTAPILQSLSMLPNLKTLEFQYDERYGMGRWNDVGSVGRCVVPTWRNGADANERIIEENQRLIEECTVLGRGDWGDLFIHQRSDGISEEDEQRYKALEDLSLVIRFEDARILILSGGTTPLSSYVSSPVASQPRQRTFPSNSASSYSHSQTPMFSSPSTPTTTPNWPANLTILYLDSEALESPRTIRKLFEAARRLLSDDSKKLSPRQCQRLQAGVALGEVGANFAGQGGAPAGNMGGAAVAGGIPGGVPLPEGPGGPDGEGYWNTWRSVRRERKFERDA